MDEKNEYTLVLIKPDGVQLAITPAVVGAYTALGLKVVSQNPVCFTAADAFALYARHEGKPYFQPLVQFMVSGPSVAVIMSGIGAVGIARQFLGATDPSKAQKISIRGWFKAHFDPDRPVANFVHASDTPADAKREIEIISRLAVAVD